jgi:two-component system sensor histidine kinase CpxA
VIRSIYTKIFLWFWVAAIGATTTVMVVTILSGSQPIGQRWMSVAVGTYAHGAVDIFLQGGKPALDRYIKDVEKSQGIRAALIDPQGQDILGKGLPPDSEDVLQAARKTGKTELVAAIPWRGATCVSTPQGNFVLVAEMRPWGLLTNPPPLGGFGLKIFVALLSTGGLCAILARHIAAPIRALQVAARRIADGELSVRAMPVIAARNDELADLARDFDRMAERVQMLLQKQQELLGDISHELRSPLTRLNVSLELLRYGEMDAVERMQTDLNRLDGLIGQILTLTRLQVREGQKIVTAVNLRSIVERMAEDAAFEGKKEGKAVVVAEAEDCWLNGDPALLRSCVENVIRNAVRYTKPQTGVIVALTKVNVRDSDYARLLVADHGNGVPPESLPRLFEPFYRVSESRDLGTGGFGLGLAIAQRVAILHGGRIKAQNRDGGGLEIEIELPLRTSEFAKTSGNAACDVRPAPPRTLHGHL